MLVSKRSHCSITLQYHLRMSKEVFESFLCQLIPIKPRHRSIDKQNLIPRLRVLDMLRVKSMPDQVPVSVREEFEQLGVHGHQIEDKFCSLKYLHVHGLRRHRTINWKIRIGSQLMIYLV